MEIRRAVREDLHRLMEIYDAARAFMRSRGNFVQWVGGYPSAELVAADIEAGEQWVCVEGGDGLGSGTGLGSDLADTLDGESGGRIAATFWFAVAPEPTYARIYDGVWLGGERPYGVVHRLASDGSVRGAGAFCLDWCLARCSNVRVDTHRDNAVMQNLLERLEYVRCGVIFIADGTPRDAFEKVVS